MVYRKFKRYVRKGFRNTYKIVKKDPVGAATKALSMAKYLHGVINSELKSISVSAIDTTNYNGNARHVTNIALGDTHYQRNGMSILAKYFTLSGQVKLRGAATASTLTMYVVMDKRREEGTAMTPTSFLEGLGNANAVNAMIDVNNRGRFKILAKRKLSVDTNNSIKNLSVNIKNINKHIKWQYNSLNQLQNHIYVVTVSNEITAGDEPEFTYQYRFKYYDN